MNLKMASKVILFMNQLTLHIHFMFYLKLRSYIGLLEDYKFRFLFVQYSIY